MDFFFPFFSRIWFKEDVEEITYRFGNITEFVFKLRIHTIFILQTIDELFYYFSITYNPICNNRFHFIQNILVYTVTF